MNYVSRFLLIMALIANVASYGMYTLRQRAQQIRTTVPVRQQPRPTITRMESSPDTTEQPSASRQIQTSTNQRPRSTLWGYIRKYTWVPFRNSRYVQSTADTISRLFPAPTLKVNLDQATPEASKTFYEMFGRPMPSGSFTIKEHMGPGYLRRVINKAGENLGMENLYKKIKDAQEATRYNNQQQNESWQEQQKQQEKQSYEQYQREQEERQRKQSEQAQGQNRNQQQQKQSSEQYQREQEERQRRQQQQREQQQQQKEDLKQWWQRRQQQQKQEQRKQSERLKYKDSPEDIQIAKTSLRNFFKRPNASFEDIHELFRQYSIKNHPDRNPNITPRELDTYKKLSNFYSIEKRYEDTKK